MGDDEEYKCFELTVIFYCKLLCCSPDIIHGKIMSNKCTKMEVFKEEVELPFSNFCTISIIQ